MKTGLRQVTLSDSPSLSELQRVLEEAPAYWRRISGKDAPANAAHETLAALPPGKTLADKFVFLIVDGGPDSPTVLGCADLVRGYPNLDTAMLGLLLFCETAHGKGYGKAAYQALESQMLSWPGIRKARIGVVATNDIVLPFWKSLGFEETGLRKPYQEGSVTSESIVLEKRLQHL